MSYKQRLKEALSPTFEGRTPLHEFVPHIVEGTVFAGVNREAMRAHGVRGKDAPTPVVLPPHWVRKRTQELAQQKAELCDVTIADTMPKPHHAEPKSTAWRWEQYSENPTPAQLRRIKKKWQRFAGRIDTALTETE